MLLNKIKNGLLSKIQDNLSKKNLTPIKNNSNKWEKLIEDNQSLQKMSKSFKKDNSPQKFLQIPDNKPILQISSTKKNNFFENIGKKSS